MGIAPVQQKQAHPVRVDSQLYSIADETGTTKENMSRCEEDDDDGEDIIQSINTLLNKGKRQSR